jgi:hypothetical protein
MSPARTGRTGAVRQAKSCGRGNHRHAIGDKSATRPSARLIRALPGAGVTPRHRAPVISMMRGQKNPRNESKYGSFHIVVIEFS